MSAVGVCSASTHTGARCTSLATEPGGQCAHHARMARVMALAPKAPAASPPPVSSSTPTPARLQETRKEFSALHLSSSSSSTSSVSSTTAVNGSRSGFPAIGSDALPGEANVGAVACAFVFPTALALPELPGQLVISNYRLVFEPQNPSLRAPGHFHRLLDDAIAGIPRASVAKLSYPQSTSTATRAASKYDSSLPTKLVIKFKDLRAWTLSGDVSALMLALNRHVFVDSPLSLFAFAFPTPDDHQEAIGHGMYDLGRDFARMGVDLRGRGASSFRLSNANANYAICATYPPQFVVPAAVTEQDVARVAEFRSKGRLPICCFVHPRNTASIWRCAQPKRGILHAQSPADEQFLERIASSNTQQRRIWIADCRPELNARVNNLTGGGTESSSIPHARVSFLNIGNIHAMRESIDNVRALVNTTNTELDLAWGTRVEDTKWLSHIRLVLSGALRVADAVENKGTTVLVHCSDGWDRTGQLCGLSQILLDAHYRTLEGFIDIIEKEWIKVGHKFHDRVGPGAADNDEQAPIFLQFLDCVWQLWRQYPTFFEFNARLLETIADALFSGRFGTFIGNCDRERQSWRVSSRTPSLWTHVLRHRAYFANPFYRERSERVLLPSASSVLRQVTLWTEYYFRGAVLPAVSLANPCSPPWGPTSVPADATNAAIPPASATVATTSDDLAAAMRAAVQKIHALEAELREIRANSYAVQMPPPIVTPSPSPIVYAAPIAAPPTAPTSAELFPPVPRPPTLEASAPLPAATAAFQYSHHANLQNGNGRVSPSPATATWTCAICSKVNVSESVTCAVCGRAPR